MAKIANFSKPLSEHELLRAIFEKNSIGITVVNVDGVIVRTNPAFRRMLGYSKKEITGKYFLDITHPDDRKRLKEFTETVLSQKEEFSIFEKRNLRKDGKIIWVRINTHLIRQNGKSRFFISTVEDITEQKKTEEALKESEQLYKTLFDTSDDGFILVEPIFDDSGQAINFCFLRLSPAYERQTGRKITTVEGKLATEVAPELEQEWISLVDKVAKTGKSQRHENYNKRTNRWYDAQYFPHGKGQVGILFRDITERKTMEEVLRESQKKYQNLIETTNDFIWEMDAQGRYTYCSSQMEKLWGIKPEEMIGKTPFDVMPPDDKERALELFMRMGNSAGAFSGLQTSAYDGQGRLIFVETNVVPFFDDESRLLGFRGISRDITERKKLEKWLQEKERLAAIGETAGMVGHDLRNPLQTLVSELYLAKTELNAVPAGQAKTAMLESIRCIEEQVNYMDKIVSDLQTFVRPVEVNKQIINLEELIASIILQIDIPKNIRTSMQLKGKLIAKTDPQLLRRVLINLITNSVQAMPQGGELTLQAIIDDNGQVQISVEDTGVGIPDDIKPKIFTLLFTTKSRGQGFGLAVCKRVIEAEGGKISFESEEGKGTKFIIELQSLNS